MNVLSIVGHIGKVADMKYTGSNAAVLDFTVAVNNGKDERGNKREPTWFTITLWEKMAEALAPYLHVGDRIGVTGQARLKIDEYKGKSYPKLVIDFPRVELLGDSNSTQTAAPAPSANRSAGRPTNQPAQTRTSRPPAQASDEDIPF